MASTSRPGARAAVAEMEPQPLPPGAAVSIASFVGVDAEGRFQILTNGALEPVTALSAIDLGASDAGLRVVIAHEDGPDRRPVIVGRLRERAPAPASAVRVDGERLLIRAGREIELRCGDASIVLTRAGKVLIRGRYVLSRSRGANKIKGASVGIN
jgi:hypothetical protein